MITRQTFSVLNLRAAQMRQGELLAARDELQEIRSTVTDTEFRRDITRSIRIIEDEMDARYDVHLLTKH